MPELWIPGNHPIARHARGWPTKPNFNSGKVPIVDWRNPSARGLFAAAVAMPFGYYDPVSGRPLDRVSGAGASGLRFTPSGSGGVAHADIQSGTGADQFLSHYYALDNTGWPSLHDRSTTLWVLVDELTDATRYYVSLGASDAYETAIQRAPTSDTITAVSTWKTLTATEARAGKTVFCIVSSGSGTYFYKNGVLIDSDTAGRNSTAAFTKLLVGANWVSGALVDYSGATNAAIIAAGAHSVPFSAGEVASLSRDVMQAFAPANSSPFLVGLPAAGGAPTLSSPGVTDIQATQATPQVTLTF